MKATRFPEVSTVSLNAVLGSGNYMSLGLTLQIEGLFDFTLNDQHLVKTSI
jgi:hypothetical protein